MVLIILPHFCDRETLATVKLRPRPQQTTMHMASPLEKLPGELLVHLMCSFYSPIDLRSFISSSPIFLQWFRTYRQSVLKPVIELLKAAYHDDEAFVYDGIQGAQLRLQAHRFPYLDPYQVKVRTYHNQHCSHTDLLGASRRLSCPSYVRATALMRHRLVPRIS